MSINIPMNSVELNRLIKEIKISKDQILREEAELNFLSLLGEDEMGAKVVFYGGTALRLAYGSPRFSEDIDLIRIKPLKFTAFESFIRKVARKSEGKWKIKDLKEKRKTFFALFLIGDDKLKHKFSLKIELHIPKEKIRLESQLALIKSPTSAAEPLLLVPTIEELRRLKKETIAEREKARDIFDLWYLSQVMKVPLTLPLKEYSYSEREFKNELQVFLPQKFYPIIKQLYEQIKRKN